ncbi:MAG: hypothetical protein SGPRY_004410 [Prymnesium sp.]
MRLHTFVVSGRALKYFVNGSLVANSELPSTIADASPPPTSSPPPNPDGSAKSSCKHRANAGRSGSPPLLTIGQALDGEGGVWELDGIVFLLLVHSRALPPAGVRRVGDGVMARPEALGLARPGDGSVDGAALRKEEECLLLDRSVLFADSRCVSHVALHASVPFSPLLKEGGREGTEGGGRSPASSRRAPPSLARDLSMAKASGSYAPREVVDEAMSHQFSCVAVIARMQWSTHPFVLLTSAFFRGLGEQMRLRHARGEGEGWDDQRGKPEVHHLVVTRSSDKAQVAWRGD